QALPWQQAGRESVPVLHEQAGQWRNPRDRPLLPAPPVLAGLEQTRRPRVLRGHGQAGQEAGRELEGPRQAPVLGDLSPSASPAAWLTLSWAPTWAPTPSAAMTGS